MNVSSSTFPSLLMALFVVIVAVGIIGELIGAILKLEYLSPLKSKEQWRLEADLSWKCFVANYAWWLRFRWAVHASLKAAAELEAWTKGEAAQVVVRWNPGSPSEKRYRLYNRFDLSS